MENENKYFELGATVFLDSGRKAVVTKVLKNNRVKIDKSANIFKINSFNGESATASTEFVRQTIYGATDEHVFEASKKIVVLNSKAVLREEIQAMELKIKNYSFLIKMGDQSCVDTALEIIKNKTSCP